VPSPANFMGLAQHIAQWSKDGSTKCGSVIVRPNKSIASLGYNGFPQGIFDNPHYIRADDPQLRVEKLKRTIHAEMNALLFLPERQPELIMYVWPMMPCHRCAVHIIQAGIACVVAPKGGPDRWEDSMKLSRSLFQEAGVKIVEIGYAIEDADRGMHIPECDGSGDS